MQYEVGIAEKICVGYKGEFRVLFLTNKKQVIAHAQKFGLFADVEMITKVLLIRSLVQTIDKILQ